jgi:hypothetical protein
MIFSYSVAAAPLVILSLTQNNQETIGEWERLTLDIFRFAHLVDARVKVEIKEFRVVANALHPGIVVQDPYCIRMTKGRLVLPVVLDTVPL